jgi:hypothetical protein
MPSIFNVCWNDGELTESILYPRIFQYCIKNSYTQKSIDDTVSLKIDPSPLGSDMDSLERSDMVIDNKFNSQVNCWLKWKGMKQK